MKTRWLFVSLLAAAITSSALRAQEPPGAPDGPSVILERVRLYLRRHGDFGRIDPEQRLAETRLAHREHQRRAAARPETIGLDTWVSLGPSNGAGRMIALAPHPTATGTLFAGAAGGGAWKTTDSGVTWTPLTDGISDLSVGALAIAPSNPSILYLGSGEGGYAIDFIPGIGLLKSTDGGTSWILPASVLATQFYKISVHPTNPAELVVGTNSGGFRSTDGGSTFASVIPTATYRNVTDLVRHPTDPSILYAATWCGFSCSTSGSRVLKSTDGGASWTEKSNGLPVTVTSPLYERLSIAMAPSNPLVLYAATSIKTGSTAAVAHVYKTIDGGDNWIDLPGVSPVSGFMAEQAWYDNTIVVSPTDASTVIAGGTSYVRSTDGGSSWGYVGGGVHVDAHELCYQGSMLWVANDGGIWTSTSDLTSSTARNATLVTRQFYATAIDPVNVNRVLAGAQDNGTVMRQDAGGTTWRSVIGGDGFECAINPTNGSIAYGTVQYGAIYRTTNAGSASPSFTSITPSYGTDATPFLTVLAMDMSAPSVLYTGSYRVWRSTNDGTSWDVLPTTTTDASTWSTSSTVGSIAVARSNGQVLMVSKSSTVFRSTDGGSTWTRRTSGLPGYGVNNLEIDPASPDVAWAALATTSGSSVYRTTDGGASWAVRSTGLPRFAAQVVRVDPTDSSDVFAGTDVGVYRSTNAGTSWALFGNGLPASSAHDIRISDDGSLVRLATHGRGAWELKAGATATSGYHTLTPCRVVDTRGAAGTYGGPALVANATRTFPLSGQCSIPASAKAAVANLTVVNATASGDLKVYPSGVSTPTATALSFSAGRTRANNGVTLGGSPSIPVTVLPVMSSGSVDLILDVSGYFE